jgi:5-methylcytosine-specific restriction endonuclease McrA
MVSRDRGADGRFVVSTSSETACITCGAEGRVYRRRICHACNLTRKRDIGRRWLAANREESVRRSIAYQQAHPESQKRRYKRWAKAHPERVVAKTIKRRVAKKGAAGSHTQAEWLAIVCKQRARCAICSVKTKMTRDHIIPLSVGGPDYAFNIQALCMPCNVKKNARVEPGSQHTLFDRPVGMATAVCKSMLVAMGAVEAVA